MPSEDLAHFTGAPRSLIWRGGAVHLRFCATAGDSPGLHAHFAAQLSVGFAGSLSLRCENGKAERLADGWLIQSDYPHRLTGAGTGVTCFWDPVSAGGRRIAARLGDAGTVALTAQETADIRVEMERCWVRGWLHSDLRAASDRIVSLIERPGASVAPIDRRVQLVLKNLQQDPTEKRSLKEFACLTKLSESRLAHLFRRDVGMAVRQYRLSLRMEQAVREIAAGGSLTRAAYAAGFADASQFCRICRRMFGSSPSRLPAFELD